MDAIRASRALLASDGEDEDAFDALLSANAQLAELGIEPHMHEISTAGSDAETKQHEIMTNPVIAAEFVAGQMRSLVINSNAFTRSATSLRSKLEEHDLLLGEAKGAYLVEGSAIDEVAVHVGMLGVLSLMTDYDAGPTDIPSDQ